MTTQRRELYHSPNGDRWFLARDSESGEVFVRHEANPASSGQSTHIEIGAFLSRGRPRTRAPRVVAVDRNAGRGILAYLEDLMTRRSCASGWRRWSRRR